MVLDIATLANDLRAAGCTVVVVDGAQARRVGGPFGPVGVLNHHTGASAKGWSLEKELQYAKWMFLTGRSDLRAPLCQIALGRSGTIYLGAAGRANHAGVAKASGSVAAGDGNTLYIGIEWMLSGTEPIPAEMTRAGTTLNAVLTQKHTKTSVKTVSCHYQTSLTGKWDIGDPHGIYFKGHRVLDVDKFREAVQAERERLDYRKLPKPKAPGDYTDFKIGHFSGQFSDSPSQWEHDLKVVFKENYDWITGTEVGQNPTWKLLKRLAKQYGYVVRRYKSNWIGVHKRNILPGSIVKVGRETVVEKEHVTGRGHDTSFLWVTFNHRSRAVGLISVIASHYPTKGRWDVEDPARTVNRKWTRKLGRAIARQAAALGKGDALCFYGGDQNLVDRTTDTFFGGPMISNWDELGKYPGTGHGNIDLIARFKGDKRVTCLGGRVFNDKQKFLYSDHFLVQSRYRVKHLALRTIKR